jgi:hypothetical protein
VSRAIFLFGHPVFVILKKGPAEASMHGLNWFGKKTG